MNVEQTQQKTYSRRNAVKLLALTIGGWALQTANPAQAEAAARRYKIVYKLNKGKNPTAQKLRVSRGKKLAVSKLKKPTRKGYTFVGWYKNKKLTKPAKYAYGRARRSYRTLYARWKVKMYKITYYPGTGASLSSKAKKSYKITTKTFSLKKPAKSGFVFQGWYTNKARTKKIAKVSKGSTGNLKLYAGWTGQTWAAHMKTKIAKVNKDIASMAGHGDAFVFITDLHWEHNAKNSPARIQELMKATAVRKTFIGGDVLTYRSSKAKALDVLKDFRKQIAFSTAAGYTLGFVRGNHDLNMDDPRSTKSVALTDKDLMDKMAIPALEAYWENQAAAAAPVDATEGQEGTSAKAERKLYYLIDNAEKKIRYLFIDTGNYDSVSEGNVPIKAGDEQYTWIKERVSELDAGWTVVAFQHMFFRESGYDKKAGSYKLGMSAKQRNGTNVKALLDSLAKDSKVKARIAALFCGHCHQDFAQRSEAGYWMIMTTTDAINIAKKYENYDEFRSKGNSSEQAFDVVVLDTSKRTIKLTRIGYGANRTFAY